jgi:hypothetical protein
VVKKVRIQEEEPVNVIAETIEKVIEPVAELIDNVVNNSSLEEKDLTEHQILEYLSQDRDNIILVFGQKIYTGHRSEIKKNIKKQENIYVDSTGNKYFQIVGRHLIDEADIKFITSKKLAIFNISTLKNVIKVNNKATPLSSSRGVYSVEPYSKDEYQEMLS